MPPTGCQSSKLRSRSTENDYGKKNEVICNCGWEIRLGYGVAVSLAIFEAKRLLLLALEIFIEWQFIQFAGGFLPVVLTFVNISLGFPSALAAVYTIRRNQLHSSIFVYLVPTILLCAVLNVTTMASIGYKVSVSKSAVTDVFNTSMYLYVTNESYKYTIDQIQFVLQCCGHNSYADWFGFDWQQVDYASKEDMSKQERISDEIYRDLGVPFSCCNLRVLGPCLHSQMIEEDTRTINVEGCSGILSNFLVRIVLVAYAMTTMLVFTQLLLAFFLARIAKKFLSRPFSARNSQKTNFSFLESLFGSEEHSCRVADYPARACKCSTGSGKKIRKKITKENEKLESRGAVVSGFSDISDNFSSSDKTGSEKGERTAKIKPSVHVEHTVPKNKIAVKRLR